MVRRPTKKTRRSRREVDQPANNPFMTLLGCAVLGVAVWLVYHSVDMDRDEPRPNDDVVDIDKDNLDPKPAPKPTPDNDKKIDLKSLYLIRVVQRKSIEADYMRTLDDSDFWQVWTKDNLAGSYEVQPGTEDAAQFEKAAGNIKPPFVMLVPNKGPPIWTIPLPKGSADEVKKKIGAPL